MSQAAAGNVPLATLIDNDCRELLGNRSSLPSMPDVAMRIRQELGSPNWSIASIAAIIRRDPGTATCLLRTANSALYGGASKIADVEAAIVRVGINSTRNLVLAHTLRSMFVTPSSFLAELMRRTWTRSARLASVCAVLAHELGGMSPEHALLAGLLQDIGTLPILNVLKPYHRQLSDEAPVLRAVDRFASAVGTILLTHWGFDEDMIEVARSRRDWFRNPAPHADLADVVLIARLHAGAVWGDDGELPKTGDVPAFAKLPLGELNDDSSLILLRKREPAVRDLLAGFGVSP